MAPLLTVILGPTAVGKTELTLSIAERLGCPVINCDSRQIFRNMKIGTAAPDAAQLARVRHYFVGQLGLDEYYSAARYEQDVLQLTSRLFLSNDVLIMSGGGMMYIDAVCNGIDDIPTIAPHIRERLKSRLETEGAESLLAELQIVDPEHYARVDSRNTKRVIHALEVFYTTGKPYSSFLTRNGLRTIGSTGSRVERPFRILKIGLSRPREELFARINARVDAMVNAGLLKETMDLMPYRDCNALNTVGYKEMFNVLDGTWELPMAIERIKKNTRVYAKKQMTWFRHDSDITWFHPDDEKEIMDFILRHTGRT